MDAEEIVKITQQHIAEEAGVTRATVSYVLSGRAKELKISDRVASRVRRIAADLGYAPNHAAMALARGRSMALGLLLGDAEGRVSPFWSPVAEGVQSEALVAGYDVLLVSARRDPESFGLNYLRQGRVDALIALGRCASAGTELWRSCPLPPVVLHGSGPPGLPAVGLDPEPGLRAAVEHLAGLGHGRLAWIGPSEGAAARGEVVRRAAADCACEATVIDTGPRGTRHAVPVERSIARWEQLLSQFLPVDLPASAILCWNDRMALATYSVLAKRGLRVPEDVSVVGFDDLEAACGLPALSTVSHEFRRMGREATRLAMRLANGELSAGQARRTVLRVPSRFVPRASTGPASC